MTRGTDHDLCGRPTSHTHTHFLFVLHSSHGSITDITSSIDRDGLLDLISNFPELLYYNNVRQQQLLTAVPHHCFKRRVQRRSNKKHKHLTSEELVEEKIFIKNLYIKKTIEGIWGSLSKKGQSAFLLFLDSSI